MKTIRRLDDLEGIEKDAPVVVTMNIRTGQGNIRTDNIGIFYQRRKQSFSVIGPLITNIGPPIAKMTYEWDAQLNTFILGESGFPFRERSKEYQKYEALLTQNFGEAA